MEGTTRDDIRGLLKEFGVRADEAVVTHLACHQDIDYLHLRITLEDLTPYNDGLSFSPLSLIVDGDIHRKK